mgnify:CR=1 FL=1|jgi:hypothetical protein
MPTVLREDGFEFMLYTHDHDVHVHKAGKEVVINLSNENTPVSIREVVRMSKKGTRKAVSIAQKYQAYLLEKWREIHG